MTFLPTFVLVTKVLVIAVDLQAPLTVTATWIPSELFAEIVIFLFTFIIDGTDVVGLWDCLTGVVVEVSVLLCDVWSAGVEFAIQIPYNVMFDETPGVYGKLIICPPLVADQPENEKPERVGAVGAVAMDPPFMNEPGDTSEPPLEL